MNDYTIPDDYKEFYDNGYFAGQVGHNLESNPYDSDAEYDSWHFWNDGFFDGLKEKLSNDNAR